MKSIKQIKTSRKAYLIKMLPKITESNPIQFRLGSKKKDFFIKIKIKIEYFKDLEDNCSIRKRKLRESDF